MPHTVGSTTWDYNPADSITMTAKFTLDVQDPDNDVDVATAVSTLAARAASVTPTVTQLDPATIQVTITI